VIPIRDSIQARDKPVVTWTLIGLNLLIYLWDRNGALFGPSVAFADLAMRPSEVTRALFDRGDPVEVGKLFTAMFLHGNIAHLLGNVLFLATFGPNVEASLGGFRFTLFYLFWGVAAFMSQIFVEPYSPIPVLGASGAIGGVLGAYFLLFPGSRVRFIVPPLFWIHFDVQAWVLLGMWFLLQVLFPQDGVATWAHAGGFMAGMASILVLGGRHSLVRPGMFMKDEEFDHA
jgi:membrane associated rhomboid family serine protease